MSFRFFLNLCHLNYQETPSLTQVLLKKGKVLQQFITTQTLNMKMNTEVSDLAIAEESRLKKG